MATTKLFTIFDCKTETYLPPFAAPTSPAAARLFSDSVNNGDSQIAAHPEDFSLFELGSYDDQTAKFELHPAPFHVLNGLQAKQSSLPVPVDMQAASDKARRLTKAR